MHGGDWEQVTIGRSGADVRRSPDGAAYAKSGTGSNSMDSNGIPGTSVTNQ